MDDDVNAELERALEVGRHESVVADDARADTVRRVRDGLQVRDDHDRVGRRLQKDHPRIIPDRGLDVRDLRSVDEAELDLVVGEDAAEEAERAAVGIIGDDDVLAGLDEAESGVNRRHPGGESVAEARAFERREVLFEGEARRVLGPRILEALVPSEALLRVGRGLVDRDGDGAGRRVGLIARVNCCCRKSHNVVNRKW
jgi:hypothetical protein